MIAWLGPMTVEGIFAKKNGSSGRIASGFYCKFQTRKTNADSFSH